MIHHIKRATRHLIFWSLLASAGSLTAVRLLLLGIDSYKTDLSARVSERMGAPVKVGHIRANMRGYNPELVLKDIKILSVVANEKPAIQLKEIRMGINLLDMLVNRDRLASAWVTLVGAKLSVKRKGDGSFAIVGLKASDEQPLWLLQGRKYEVLQSEVTWQDEKKHGRPLKFEAVDLAIINNDQQHRLNVLMQLPKKFGKTLTVSMNLTGNVFKPSAVDGSVFIDGKNLNLAEWVTADLPASMIIHSGAGNVRLWSEVQHSQAVSITGDVQLHQLHLSRQDKGVFPVKQLDTRFRWTLADSQWQLDVPRFLLETSDKKWPAAAFSVSVNRTKDNLLHNFGLFVEQVDLQEASSVLQFFAPLPKEAAVLLAQAQPKGSLEHLSLFADLDQNHFAVNGKFANINIAATAAIPGIENLSGQLKGSDQQGEISLATQDAQMTSQGLFRDALLIKKLNGTVTWQQTPDDWILASSMIELDSPDIQTKNKLLLKIPKTDGQIFMDLQTAFAGDDISKAKLYLPAGIMDKPVVDWLDNAFIRGRVPKGGMLFYGNLNDFPFTGGQGVFETLFEVDQMELSYHPEWPHLTDLGGEVLFLNNGLQIDLHKGESNKVKINQAKVTIPALGESEHLLVQGKLETGILPGLEFLQKTPLHASIDKLLGAIEPQGDTSVTLDLKLPLADGATAKVDGVAQLNKARLTVKSPALSVSKIDGLLKFNELGVYSEAINAAALGQPIQINVKSSDSQTTVNVAGRTGISDLQKQFKLPEWQFAEGTADYQLKLQLPYNDSSPELLVESKLAGVALNLPGALAKTREQQRPLSLTFNLTDKALLPISLNYDNQLKAAIKLNINQQTIESGNVLIGTGSVAEPQEAGIKLEINRDRLALQDWLGLASSLAPDKNSQTKTGAVDSLREIKIHSEHGLWEQADLGFIDLVLKPEGNYWTGTINSSLAKGKLKIPVDFKGTDSINLAMDELNLSLLKRVAWNTIKNSDNKIHNGVNSGVGNLAPSYAAPESIPLLTITGDKTLWESVDLGKINLETGRIPNGIAFKRMVLAGDDQTLSVSGDWKADGKKSATRMQGNLIMPRADRILSKLGITKDFAETSAVIDFTCGWNAAPYQVSLADLQGQIDANFKDGRILSVEPGFGRILGILAMAQWIKRFQLDFSDVFQEGLTFTTIKGHFDLLNGKASTNDLVVDAIPAKITLTGNTDLINRTVDYVVSVVPKSADAVPIAGTIMGKVAALIGRSLTGKDQEGFFFGSQYLVKGVWRDAQIIPLHENDGLLQKTWNGLTDFSWLQQLKEQ
jgi:uncharacterized protein (TIGR02099 family)